MHIPFFFSSQPSPVPRLRPESVPAATGHGPRHQRGSLRGRERASHPGSQQCTVQGETPVLMADGPHVPPPCPRHILFLFPVSTPSPVSSRVHLFPGVSQSPFQLPTFSIPPDAASQRLPATDQMTSPATPPVRSPALSQLNRIHSLLPATPLKPPRCTPLILPILTPYPTSPLVR